MNFINEKEYSKFFAQKQMKVFSYEPLANRKFK